MIYVFNKKRNKKLKETCIASNLTVFSYFVSLGDEKQNKMETTMTKKAYFKTRDKISYKQKHKVKNRILLYSKKYIKM